MTDAFNIFDENNPIINSEYKKDNYRINCYDNASDLVVVYFSSNGLYYPDTAEEFKEKIAKEDRYEYSRYRFDRVSMEIYLRDIRKQFYITGINRELNTVDKVADFIIERIPKGSRVITVGNSAGGYAAALFGTLVHADYVLDFSGQNTLYGAMQPGSIVEKYSRNPECYKYYDLTALWNERGYVPTILYFYAGLCEKDIEQTGIFSKTNLLYEKIFPIGFKTMHHAKTMFNFNLPYLFSGKKNNYGKLISLSRRLKGRLISRISFSIALCGLYPTMLGILRKAVLHRQCQLKNQKTYRNMPD